VSWAPGRRGVVAVLVLAAGLPAQATATYERLPAAGLRFGDAFELLVRVELARQEACDALPTAAFLPLQVELLSVSDASPAPAGATQLWRYRAVATHLGPLAERQLAVPVRTADGTQRELSLRLPPLQIASVLPEAPGELEWDLPLRALPAARWPWLLGVLVLVLSGTLWFWRRKTAQFEPQIEPPVTAPREAAAAVALRALQDLPLPASGDAAAADAFAGALVAILRRFLADHSGMPADARTTDELARLWPVAETPLPQCLALCDCVRFAALCPPPDQLAAAVAAATSAVAAVPLPAEVR